MLIKRLKSFLKKKALIHLTIKVETITPNNYLHNRCALITGGTSGIGYELARSFLNAGASVIITGRDLTRINNACEKLKKEYTHSLIYGYQLNNTRVDSFESTFYDILKTIAKDGLNYIDILVNNAGVNAPGMPNANEKDYDLVMDTNLKGTFFLSQLFGKYLVKNKIKGNILNIASASSLRPADSAYTLSKWGLRGLTLGLAKSLSKYGITVNGIAPGPTATPMMLKNEQSNMYLKRIPLGRYIMPEEIANMAVILTSNFGKSIIGDIIYMTGGAGNLTYDDVQYTF